MKDFINLIIKKGFEQKSKNIWEQEKKIQQQSQVIIINNQPIQTPGKVISIKYYITFLGFGGLENKNDCDILLQFNFKIIIENDTKLDFDELFYFNDLKYFENILNNYDKTP